MKTKLVTFIIIFTAMLLTYGATAYAQNTYFNSYYVSINGGLTQTTPNGVSSKTGDTINMSVGKNFNFNNLVIGGEATLGYGYNGNWTLNNVDGYGDNLSSSIHSYYYALALKGGYAMQNIMPFIKLGYISYTYNGNLNYSGQYSNYLNDNLTHSLSVNGSGLLYGVGIEYMINQNWGITAQYLGSSLSGSGKGHNNNYTVGLSYNF